MQEEQTPPQTDWNPSHVPELPEPLVSLLGTIDFQLDQYTKGWTHCVGSWLAKRKAVTDDSPRQGLALHKII